MLTFAPDAQDISPQILTAVSGIPTMRGYASPPTAGSALASALGGAPNGGAIVMDSTGASRILVAANGHIYEFGSGAWSDRGTLSTSQSWFTAFGSDTYLFNISSKPYKITGSSTPTAVTGPKAKAGDAGGYFLLVGNTDDGSTGLSTSFGAQPARWWCSKYADGTSWEPSVQNQCASGLLSDSAGGIVAIRALGDKFAVYKAGALYLATYVGPPDVFAFQRISDRIGATNQAGVIKVDGVHYFIGSENIWRFDGGGPPVPIGDSVREWFFASLDRPNNMLIQGRHDPYNRLIYWHYPGAGGSTINKVLVYHYPSGRFGAFDLTVTQVFNTEGGQLFATTVDGTARQLSMVYTDASYVLKSLTADGTALTMTTGWYGDEWRVSLCDRVKPKFRTAPTTGTITHSTCMFIGETPVTGSAATLTNGRADMLMSGRYHRDTHSYTGAPEIESHGANLVPEGTE